MLSIGDLYGILILVWKGWIKLVDMHLSWQRVVVEKDNLIVHYCKQELMHLSSCIRFTLGRSSSFILESERILWHAIFQVLVINIRCKHKFFWRRLLEERKGSFTQRYAPLRNLRLVRLFLFLWCCGHFKLKSLSTVLLLLVEIQKERVASTFRVHYNCHIGHWLVIDLNTRVRDVEHYVLD